MVLAPFRILIHELLNKDTGRVPYESLLIILDGKYSVCMHKNGRYTNHIRHIYKTEHFLNGEK